MVAAGTFPLIWVGGLVTTYEAGMAVPDWPNTYGYNLFLYPWESWIKVWDIFLEHSHRLIGATVGMFTIALAVALWWKDGRRWMRWLGVVALAGVSFQGTLGGLRVIDNARVLANVHGCTAPLFFGLAVALVVFTSRRWMGDAAPLPASRAGSLRLWTLAAVLAVYFQIVLGAQLRHLEPWPSLFPLWLWLHLLMLAVLATMAVRLVLLARRIGQVPVLTRWAWTFAGVFALQLTLGVATWVMNYGWPKWFQEYIWPLAYTVQSESFWQAVATTAHVAVGSVLLVSVVVLALWSRRLVQPERLS